MTGAAWTNSSTEHHFEALGTFATVYQAELHAILRCTQEINERQEEGKAYLICTDSQAALKTLMRATFTSKQARNCHEVLNEIGTRNQITLTWVPGHTGIIGNEIADQLANRGSDTIPIGPQPIIGIPEADYLQAIKKWKKETSAKKWSETEGLRHSKEIIGEEPSFQQQAAFIEKNRRATKIITGIYTGHETLNLHLQRIGRRDTKECELCREVDSEETSIHLLTECPATTRTRLRILGDHTPNRQDIKKIPLNKLLKYFETINPWKY
ncbi:uncharacterized protein LOC143219919 [Lasioglossum baleicum]|uniref:uncharacterized protein LOC143219919 n=1 Tax=Lasioglossum baleicum TaxID=434251 RepID=UPI003FCDB465